MYCIEVNVGCLFASVPVVFKMWELKTMVAMADYI